MAAFADRAALLTFIAADTQRSDLTSTLPVFLALVEGDLKAALKVRPMVERWTVTIDAEFMAFPTDFAGARTFRLTTGTRRRVGFVTPDQMAGLKSAESVARTGEPEYFTILGDEFEFYPDPGGEEYPATLTGYLGVTDLTADASTNWLLAKHPAVYVAGMRKYIFRRSRNAAEIARADADFATQLAAIYANSIVESYADDLTPSVGMVV